MTYHIEIRKLAINLILQHGIVKISKFLKISRITLWRWQSRGVDAIKRVYKSLLFEKIKFELENCLMVLVTDHISMVIGLFYWKSNCESHFDFVEVPFKSI